MSMKENVNEVVNIVKDVITSAGGPAGKLIRGVIDFDQNIKQRRLFTFTELVMEYFEKVTGEPMLPEHCNHEDIHDAFVMVCRYAVETRNEEKQKRFARILVNQVVHPEPVDMIGRYVELTSKLDSNHIRILQKHDEVKVQMKKLANEIQDNFYEQQNVTNIMLRDFSTKSKGIPKQTSGTRNLMHGFYNNRLKEIKEELSGYSSLLAPSTYSLNRNEFLVLLNDLEQLGLMKQGTFLSLSRTADKFYVITYLGEKYLEHLKFKNI